MRKNRKMTHEELIAWVQTTFKEICFMLDLLDIPYETGHNNLPVDCECYISSDKEDDQKEYNPQIRFPWHEGDVVVGTLNCFDDMVRLGRLTVLASPYPSIESFRFPWDEDDVTVFSSPVEAVRKIAELYETISKKEQLLEYGDHDIMQSGLMPAT